MDKRHPIMQEWRKRLAKNARAFRRIEGRWPGGLTIKESRETLRRIKDSIEWASESGVRPPYQH